MASADDWADAYLRQAKAELDAARENIGAGVRAMLLQMVFEKIAKAALLRSGQWAIAHTQTTHSGASHMMQLLTIRRYQSRTTYSQGQLRNSLKPLVDELENLQPAIAAQRGRISGPWLEYPWETPQGLVAVPSSDLPNLKRYGAAHAPTMALLMRFAGELLARHKSIFG